MNYAVVFKTISTVLWEYAISQTSHFPFEVCLKKYEILVDYERQYYSQLKSWSLIAPGEQEKFP